jgi:uncharacterized membrane protein YidH (DUF202 family)
MIKKQPPEWYVLFAVSAALTLFTLASLNRLTFPFPWNDEARFYLPALWWQQHQSFQPLTLHAPSGIFWVPDGFTVYLGLAIKFFGQTMERARLVCELTVSVGVFLYAIAFRKISGSWKMGALTTLLILTPPVVFAANEVRMESVMFTLVALILLMHLNGYILAAGSLLFAGLLFHPALGLAAVAYAIVQIAIHFTEKTKLSFAWFEYLLFAIVTTAFILEIIHILNYWQVFNQHMAYQVQRKLNNPIYVRVMKPQGLILLICCLVVLMLLWLCSKFKSHTAIKDILPIAVIALGLAFYGVLGFEMTYNVYSVSVGPALVFCLAAKVFDKHTPRFPRPEQI